MVKKPALTFTLDREGSSSVAASAPIAPKTEKTGRSGMKQVGTRLPEHLYRQLKAHAALTGVQVQAVLEEAITDYLRTHG